MNRWLVASGVLLLLVLAPLDALSKTLTVAVIDTGIDSKSNGKLCRDGHKSFSDWNPDPLKDNHGHGTHVAGLIERNAGPGDYCLLSLTFYSDSNSGSQNLANMVKAINYAIAKKVDFINISGGGPTPNMEEMLSIMHALDLGIKVVVAAGNEHFDLDKSCNYFPACYDKRIVMVGNYVKQEEGLWRTPARVAAASSNYGSRVTRWEVGEDVLSSMPGGRTGRMSGTSQAAGVATGKLLKERL